MSPRSATSCARCSRRRAIAVVEADTAARARDRGAQRTSPDLLLVDLGLPDGDGLTLIRRVRAWSPVPIIVLSARTMEEQKIAALDAGADDYVTKPFSAPELLARVRAALRRDLRRAAGSRSAAVLGFARRSGAPRDPRPRGRGASDAARVPRARDASRGTWACIVMQQQLIREVWGPERLGRLAQPAGVRQESARASSSRSRAGRATW